MACGIGAATRRRLRQRIGPDEDIVTAGTDDIAHALGIGDVVADAMARAIARVRPDRERAAMRRASVQLILRNDVDFPPLLALADDAPDALYIRGVPPPVDDTIAIVGSRRCSDRGRTTAFKLARDLAATGATIVSGGARGIDAAAHRGALAGGGPTAAVLGCGLSRLYPPEHTRLFDSVIDRGGAILSELPMHAAPRPENFPRRNRIVAAMSYGTVVIEAGARSGALITARLAAEQYGREVMAFPGTPGDSHTAGCHRLIRDGGAALVESVKHVREELAGSPGLKRAIGLVSRGDASIQIGGPI